MNRNTAMIADLLCWVLLLVAVFIGPVWVTKLAIAILAICHIMTVVMVYQLRGVYVNSELDRIASNIMRNMFSESSERDARWDN